MWGVAALALLSACGGGSSDDSGTGHVRFLNASTDYASIDLYSTDTLLSKGTASFAASDYTSLSNGSYSFRVKRVDSTTTTLSTDRSIASDTHNTRVFYNTASAVRSIQVIENEAAPTVTTPTSGLSVTAGADLTLMVLGSPEAPQVSLLNDDNRRSLTGTNARLRLVHGVNNLIGGVTLTADYSTAATNIAFGLSSTPIEATAGTAYRLEATSPVTAADLYLATDVTLQANRVYTVFVLGEAGTSVGFLRRDR